MTTQTIGTVEEWLSARLKSTRNAEVAMSQALGPRDNLARWVFFVDCDRPAGVSAEQALANPQLTAR